MNSKITGQGDAAAEEVHKSIAIFGYKQSLLSVDMKTKVVQHVERERVKLQLLSDIQTFFGH